MTSRDHARYSDWDAAYVLGALGSADRRAFEAHLEDCERCRAAVGELAAMPGLLGRARPAVTSDDVRREIEDPALDGAPSAELIDLGSERHDRQQPGFRRRLVLGFATAAAAVTIAVAVPILVTGPPAAVATVALAPVADSSMTATVALSPVTWGTSISVECDYPAGGTWGGEDGLWTYALVVTDEAGRSSQVSTWQAVPGKTLQLDAATAIPLDQIATLEVRKADGEVILAAPVDG